MVIVEGPTDAWRLGTNAVATLGKGVSQHQRGLLCSHFAGRPLVEVPCDRHDAPRAVLTGDWPPLWAEIDVWIAWVRSAGDPMGFTERACDRLNGALFELDQLIGALEEAPVSHEYRRALASELDRVTWERLSGFIEDLDEEVDGHG